MRNMLVFFKPEMLKLKVTGPVTAPHSPPWTLGKDKNSNLGVNWESLSRRTCLNSALGAPRLTPPMPCP